MRLQSFHSHHLHALEVAVPTRQSLLNHGILTGQEREAQTVMGGSRRGAAATTT